MEEGKSSDDVKEEPLDIDLKNEQTEQQRAKQGNGHRKTNRQQ